MSSQIVPPFGIATIAVAAAAKVAAYSAAPYTVDQVVGYPNEPPANQSLFNNSGLFAGAAFTLAGSVVVQAGSQPVLVNVGVAGNSVYERLAVTQPTPGVLNATGPLTAALILTGIVTSTTGAAVVATLDTGTVMDTSGTFAIGDSFDWTAIATGANSFTVTAAAGHTIVGAAAVATLTSGRFRTTKTAANTFITYRLS
jgi:hypothetical protein